MFRILITLCVCFAVASAAYAQSEAVDDFGDVLNQCSQNLRQAILAEGEPVDFPAKKERCRQVLASRVSAQKKLTQIAALCDYTMQRSGSVYLLSKKYINPLDFPCVTIEEMAVFVRDVNALGASIVPAGAKNKAANVVIADLLQSLSPQDRKVAEKSGLPVTDLGQAEQKALQSVLASVFFIGLPNAAKKSLVYLEEWPQISLYEGGGVLRIRLKKEPRVAHDTSLLQQGFDKLQPDSAVPVSRDLLQSKTETVDTLVTKIKRGDASFSCRVSPVVADKPVTVSGLSFAEGNLILRGVARLYDLRYERGGDGFWRIGRAPQPKITNIANVQGDIWKALPAPLRVILRMKTKDWSNPAEQNASIPQTFPLTAVAYRYLRALSPLVRKSGNKGVLLADIPARGRAAYALCVTGNLLVMEIKDVINRRLPPYLTNFDVHVLHYQTVANTAKNLDFSLWRRAGIGWKRSWAISASPLLPRRP